MPVASDRPADRQGSRIGAGVGRTSRRTATVVDPGLRRMRFGTPVTWALGFTASPGRRAPPSGHATPAGGRIGQIIADEASRAPCQWRPRSASGLASHLSAWPHRRVVTTNEPSARHRDRWLRRRPAHPITLERVEGPPDARADHRIRAGWHDGAGMAPAEPPPHAACVSRSSSYHGGVGLTALHPSGHWGTCG
jgi:hypothetical protein